MTIPIEIVNKSSFEIRAIRDKNKKGNLNYCYVICNITSNPSSRKICKSKYGGHDHPAE